MKAKTIYKLLLDIAMTVLFVMLVFDFGTGAFFHEAVGIAIGVMFILHVLLNIKLLKGMCLAAAKGKLSPTKTILLVLDLILPILILADIITGIVISRVLFEFSLSASMWLIIYNVHNIISYVCLGILALHLLLHASYLAAVIKNIFTRPKAGGLLKASAGFLASAAALCIIYVSVHSVIDSDSGFELVEPQTAAPTTVSTWVEITMANENAEEVTNSFTVSDDPEAEPQTDKIIETQPETAQDVPSLADYLSKLFCTGCSKHCPLSSPQCGKGMAQASQAEQEYQQQYNS